MSDKVEIQNEDLKWLIELGRREEMPRSFLLTRCEKEIARLQRVEAAAKPVVYTFVHFLEINRIPDSEAEQCDSENIYVNFGFLRALAAALRETEPK